MRRADRLFQIIQLLRGRSRAVTASWLAEQLEVSERTIYRDVRDLIASGTPLEGEAGVGYQLRRDYDLPPLMFDTDEVEALVLGARIAASVGDAALAKAARSVLSKVEAVLPAPMKPRLTEAALFAPRTWSSEAAAGDLLSIRTAMAERRKIRTRYERKDGVETSRVVRPVGAFFWGKSWTLTAWCELRNDFRNFRLDRMNELELMGETFDDEPGKTLRDYLAGLGEDTEQLLAE